MLELDGGAGGGQLVRTAVTLSALSGESIRMENVRGARDPGGLKAQHCAAIEAVTAACDAELSGVHEGSAAFTFEPGELSGGDIRVDVGTAGSITLVFDTLLPLATRLDSPLSVAVTGGTDVRWSPPFDYLRHVKLPLLLRYGLDASISVKRRGFYPAGGGKATLSLRPSALDPVSLTERGELRAVTVYSAASTHLEGDDVADRQAGAAAEYLNGLDAPVERVGRDIQYATAPSPGSVVVLAAEYEHSRAGFSALGERGKPAEAVGTAAAEAFESFNETNAAVDRHLADQLLPYVALAGGEVVAPERTNHVETCLDLLQSFGYDVELAEARGGVHLTGPQ